MNTVFGRILKPICLTMSFLFVLSMLTGCGDSTTNTSTEASVETEQSVEESKEPEPLTLNIGSYNIAHGQFCDYDMKNIANDILEKNLDIVGLQEVDINADRSKNIDSLKDLSEATGYEYYAYFKTVDLATDGQYGVAVLSKYPILETERYDLPSQNVEARVLGHAKVDVNGTSVNFFVTHISFENVSIRTEQLTHINSVLKDFDNFILAGDFNTSDFNNYKVFENAKTLNTAENNLPTHQKTESIDNIVYSEDDWNFEPPAVLENDHSDHSMLYSKATYINSTEK